VHDRSTTATPEEDCRQASKRASLCSRTPSHAQRSLRFSEFSSMEDAPAPAVHAVPAVVETAATGLCGTTTTGRSQSAAGAEATTTTEDVATVAERSFLVTADSAGAAAAGTCGSEIRMLDSDDLTGLSEYKTCAELQNASASQIRHTLLQTLGEREISDALQLFCTTTQGMVDMQKSINEHQATLEHLRRGLNRNIDVRQEKALEVCNTCIYIFLPVIRFLPCLLFDFVI